MLVTITTDASFYHKEKTGGYAFWIKSNIETVKCSGAFKSKVESPDDAEFKCIINSLHRLKSKKWTVTEIIVNTDSQNTISLVADGLSNLKYASDNLKAYKAIKNHFNCTITFRHVKAHKHTNTARHWVNNWCDKEAKKAARIKIKFGNIKE